MIKKVAQLITTLFCVAALMGIGSVWAKHCQNWNAACIAKEKEENVNEKAKEAEKSSGETAENAGQVANIAENAIKNAVSSSATATVDWTKKQTISLRELTQGVSKDGEGIWYSPVPNKKVRLQASFGADAETNVVNVMRSVNETDGRKNYPVEVRQYIDYYEGRENPSSIPPEKVSHRRKQSSVDDQGNRSTSTVFAIGAAFEAIIGEKTKISKEYMFSRFKKANAIATCRGLGINLDTAKAILLRGETFPEERHWRYKPFTVHRVGDCPGDPPYDAKKQAFFRAKDVFRFGAKEVVSAKNPAFIEAWLDAGYDFILALGIAWPQNTLSTRYPRGSEELKGVIDVKKVAGEPAPSYGNHAMLIVGYQRTDMGNIGGGYFLLKNSWGRDVGESGYVKLSYDYIRTYAIDGMVIAGVTKR